MESAITLESYPVPYAFPFNLVWDKIGYYDSVKFPQYKNFILFGNALYNYYTILIIINKFIKSLNFDYFLIIFK